MATMTPLSEATSKPEKRRLLRLSAKLIRIAFKGRLGLTLAIIAADGVSAIARVAAVISLSLIAIAMQNEGLIAMMGFKLQLPASIATLGYLAAAAVGSLYLVSSLAAWTAVYLARRLARWMTEQQILRVLASMQASTADAIRMARGREATASYNFNRILTQNAIHAGMMTETLIRIANPVALFGLSWLVVMWQAPLLGVGIIAFAALFLPVFIAQYLKTGKVAQDFYSDAASVMGQDVSRIVNRLDAQHGVYAGVIETRDFTNRPPMKNFLTSLDSNILANERIGVLVGVIGSLFIAFVIAVNAYLASLGRIDIAAIIAIAGSFLYLIASARMVASMLTNLVRYTPQVANVLGFNLEKTGDNQTQDLPRTLTIKTTDKPSSRLVLGRGEALIVKAPVRTSRFGAIATLAALMDSLQGDGGDINADALSAHSVFCSDYYRFQPDTTVLENLTGGRSDAEDRVRDIIMDMGVLEEFAALSDGLSTVVTEGVYQSLTGTARTALRLVPILSIDTPRLLLINVGAVRNLNPRLLVRIFDWAPESFRIFFTRDTNVPPVLGDNFAVIGPDGIRDIGDRSILSQAMTTQDENGGDDIGTAMF